MRVLVQHHSHYTYPRPAQLGPHTLRLHPAPHVRADIETYALRVEQPHRLRWQEDPFGNRIARVDFIDGEKVQALDVSVEIAADIGAINPFDFLLEPYAEHTPFSYPEALRRELAPCLALDDPAFSVGERFAVFDAEVPREGNTITLVSAINVAVNKRVRYVIREEAGVFTPEEALAEGRASCRDSAILLIALLRRRGLAARFASGYLVQLTDDGMLPDQPRGVLRDVVDLHAWCEVYLPGAGWVGLDATSGLLCGEGHIALCCASSPALASPLEGTSTVAASEVSFSMTVRRIGHEPSPTSPYTDAIWTELCLAGDAVDARLENAGVTLTIGGEPTFNARDNTDAPEWNGAALGEHKLERGMALANELVVRLAPGGAILQRHGKWYPGEPLPRWALEIVARRDGVELWPSRASVHGVPSSSDVERFARALAKRLGLTDAIIAAFEDPWPVLREEATTPIDDTLKQASLDDAASRRRLVGVLDRGVTRPAGWVLPIAPSETTWRSEAWRFRREKLYLLPGDSPIGLRLPLASLVSVPADPPDELDVVPPDLRRELELELAMRRTTKTEAVRTALCVEEREGALWVFLPPLPSFDRFVALLAAIDATRSETTLDVRLEGYAPSRSPDAIALSVTPDPGVLEVNVPPSTTLRDHRAVIEQVFDAALHTGLHAEKYLLDGRMAGSGGGNHITFGGTSPEKSPFLVRPDLLASLVTFVQNHPSLSYLFAGLFVGPTSQAPRVDEARHDTLYELELALQRAFDRTEPSPPWLTDLLFRHLLVDLTGNTHRSELCIDKLYDPQTPHGRQGLVELRAFEMPPHPRMIHAQVLLVRALLAAFVDKPYQAPLVRWGSSLHDRFLLPHALWTDLLDVLSFLSSRGIDLPEQGYLPFLALRCPLVGTLQADEVTLEVRNAIEPWNVLGEELTTTGTSRFVDSSMERIEVRARGLVAGRHVVLVNGYELPLHPTRTKDVFYAGVRFRAWAPAHSLQAHLGVHHPVKLDVVDTWAKRSLGGCAYHVWHPEGRAFDAPPLTRNEAAARRAQRFTIDGPASFPVEVKRTTAHPDAPITFDLRRLPIDRPQPAPYKLADEQEIA